jgi:hypothetical protein
MADTPLAHDLSQSIDDVRSPPEHVPFMQRLLDNHFLLLFLGVTLPAVLYVLWGVMEVANIPIAR